MGSCSGPVSLYLRLPSSFLLGLAAFLLFVKKWKRQGALLGMTYHALHEPLRAFTVCEWPGWPAFFVYSRALLVTSSTCICQDSAFSRHLIEFCQFMSPVFVLSLLDGKLDLEELKECPLPGRCLSFKQLAECME